MPAGLAFREGKAGTFFEDMNPYLVHTVRGKEIETGFEFRLTDEQMTIRKRLYLGKVMAADNIYRKYN